MIDRRRFIAGLCCMVCASPALARPRAPSFICTTPDVDEPGSEEEAAAPIAGVARGFPERLQKIGHLMNEGVFIADLQARFASLTPRERQIMALLAEGRITKQIAGEIGISAMTVRIHRGQVISKMGARSTADLVRMGDKLGLQSSKAQAD